MSSEIAVRVSNLSKCYHIYECPRDRLKQFVFPRLFRRPLNYFREFWALREVSFEIRQGEVVGIIGCNGSGKSTLLQMICGTLAQTHGDVAVFGRVAALLELGSGFNPEFTGRENVYMNASVLGLSREEIDARFDDIVAFAEVGDFLDQPVKTYSSGMFVRLAFAVIINVSPEILIIDEALAVGDAKFQLKCFRKLDQLKDAGVTILFVTHDTSTVKSFCSRALLLNGGRLLGDGEPKEIVMQYFDLLFPQERAGQESVGCVADAVDAEEGHVWEGIIAKRPDPSEKSFGIGGAFLDSIKVQGVDQGQVVSGGDRLSVTVLYRWDAKVLGDYTANNGLERNLIVGVSLSDSKGTYIFGCTTYDKDIHVDIAADSCLVSFNFAMPNLHDGKYFINSAFALGTQEVHVQLCWYDGVLELNMQGKNRYVYGILYNDYDVVMKGC